MPLQIAQGAAAEVLLATAHRAFEHYSARFGAVEFSDDVRAREAPYRRDETVRLAPGQVLVIDFDAEMGGITFQ